ncbi:MAG TPA: EAL domain-containing protein [Dehalococcoidia bacterium]|nr:EAL domain-containing protein [Dehalococcoidia bacterium]
MKALLRHGPFMCAFLRGRGETAVVYDCSPSLLVRLRRRRREVVGRPFGSLFSPVADEAGPAGPDSPVQPQRGHLFGQGGEAVPVLLWLSPIDDEPLRTVAFMVDISDLDREQRELSDSKQWLESILNTIRDAVWVLDREERIVFANRSFAFSTGFRMEELLGRHITVVLPEDQLQRARQVNRSHIRGEAPPAPYELEVRTRDGRVIPIEVHINPVRQGGRVVGLIGVSRDISERRRFQQQLAQMARTDPLTGVLNRRAFMEEVEREIVHARREGKPCALLFIDLDGFKEVNDQLGHRAGDQLLRTVVERVRQSVHQPDVVGRLGGDEFGVLLPETDGRGAAAVASRILDTLECPVLLFGQAVPAVASIGVALFPDHANDAEELLARADVAMYKAKAEGGRRAVVYEPGEAEARRLQSRLSWEGRVRSAMAEGRLRLYCQPIVDLRNGRVDRYELLLRLLEDGEVIPAGAFLPAIERTDLMRQIDQWVVEQALALLRRLEANGQHVHLHVDIHINISGRTLGQNGATEAIDKAVRAAMPSPGRLVFEVTETADIADLDGARQFMLRMKELGCAFAADDFGVGYNSLQRLRLLPFDFIKIDGSFVAGLVENEADRRLVRAIAAAARAVGMESIAEQVEDGPTLAALRKCRVDYAQGYWAGLPRPVEEVWPDAVAAQ